MRCGACFPHAVAKTSTTSKKACAQHRTKGFSETWTQQTHTSTNHQTKVTRCGARQDTNYGETLSISTKHMWCTTQAQLHPLVSPKDDNATNMRRQDTKKKRGCVNNHKHYSHLENKSTPTNTQNNFEFDCPNKDNNNNSLIENITTETRRMTKSSCNTSVVATMSLSRTRLHISIEHQRKYVNTRSMTDNFEANSETTEIERKGSRGNAKHRSSHESPNLSTPT